MSAVIQHLGEESQLDNAPHRLDYQRLDLHDPHISASKVNHRDVFAYGVVFGGLWLILLAVVWIAYAIASWGLSRYDWTPSTWVFYLLAMGTTIAPAIAGVGYAVIALWSRVQRTRAETYRARITRDRYSNPIDALAIINKQPIENWSELLLATKAEIAMAPFKQLPAGLDSFSVSQNSNTKADSPLGMLPDADSPVKLMPPSEWLDLINDPDGEPHILLAGKTKAGKSTLAEVILARRVERGDDVFIIDPHYQPTNKDGEVTWCGLRGVGGDGWRAVKSALSAVRAEYERRKKAANNGEMPPGGFKPLTVVIDEVPEIYESLKDEWEAFQAVMGSGARKYSIYVVLVTQSHLIKDIGGSTCKRENFVIVGLNEKAKMLVLGEAYDTKQKAAMLETLRGQQWSAAMVYRNEVHLLDRTGTKEMRPISLEGASVWSAGSDNTPQNEDADQTDRLNIYMEIASSGVSRENAAKIVRSKLGGFDNNLWTEARKELGLI